MRKSRNANKTSQSNKVSQANPATAADRIQAHQDIEVPWAVWTIMGAKQLLIMGDQVCLSPDGDYANLQQARAAVEFYVKQLNGEVKWD